MAGITLKETLAADIATPATDKDTIFITTAPALAFKDDTGTVHTLGAGTVTSVSGTAPIASSGGATPAISLNNTAVTPGSYTRAGFTVDAQGRLTAAATGTTPLPQRTNTTASSATPSINVDTTDIFTITALAAAITSMTTNLTGTPVNGQHLTIRILDNGTARAITWGASFVSRGATLPTTTVLSKYVYVGLIWNSTASVWDCVAVAQET